MFAVGSIAVVTLGSEGGLTDLIYLVSRDESEHVREAWKSLRITMAHAESATNCHIITCQLAVLSNGDEA